MMQGQRHLIECNCILPQFKKRPNPPFHKFLVFSKVDDEGNVVVKLAQCNNCLSIHRVIDLCKSEILPGREQASSVVTVDDIKLSMSRELADILTKYSVDLPTWEHAEFILENERWGDMLLLASEEIEGRREGKALQVLGRSIFKVIPFTRANTVG